MFLNANYHVEKLQKLIFFEKMLSLKQRQNGPQNGDRRLKPL
jgi:hypothetical protein